MKKSTPVAILIAAALIGGAIVFLAVNKNGGNNGSGSVNNVSTVDGVQVITISAKGGYSPRVTNARAGLPTIIKMDTLGTFDCSSAVAIPSLGYRDNLPPSGETLIDVPPQKAGTTMQGLCAMGMYNFTINFN